MVTDHSQDAAAPSAGLAESLDRLVRGQPQALAGLLHDVEVHSTLDESRVVCHCHSLKLDGNGRPRVRDLVKAICDHVLDFAIPRGEIAAAKAEMLTSGSTAKLARLHTEARRLFTDLEQTGEGGELLLFVLSERLLRLPQLLCKMDLKTNTRMHVHGADGLHAGVDEASGRLVLYWGESKIFGNATEAIRDCLESLAPMLLDDANGGAAPDRDFQLLQRHADLEDPALEAAFKQFLDVDGEHYNSVEFRGLCLVGFDCEAYPATPAALNADAVVAKVTELLPRWKQQILRRVKAETLDAFGMHFICVPFPSAEDFRDRLLQELDLARPKPAGAQKASPAAAEPAQPSSLADGSVTAPAGAGERPATTGSRRTAGARKRGGE
jgi:hypothetical protein